MLIRTERNIINGIIKDEIERYLEDLDKKSKYRRCFNCGEPFPLKHRNKIYCNSRCARAKHYLRFNVRKGSM